MSMPKATHIALACTALLVVHADVRAQSEAAPSETNTEVLPIVEVTVSKRRQKAIDVPSALTTVPSAIAFFYAARHLQAEVQA